MSARRNVQREASPKPAADDAVALLTVEEFGARIVLPVHDELLVEALFGHAQEVAHVIRQVVIGQCEQTLDNVLNLDAEQFYGPSRAANEALWTYDGQAMPPFEWAQP